MLGALATLGALAVVVNASPLSSRAAGCDTVDQGYQCQPQISHFWGQYSPYFSVPSEISAELPECCEVTFAQVLSRHGARDPTASKTALYNATINKIHSKVKNYTKDYEFIKKYEYTLGADELTLFGEQEMINSGIKFFERYQELSERFVPFVRSSGENRVVESAMNWTQGFHQAKLADRRSRQDSYPYPIVAISEANGSNNTLNHGLCTSFENGSDSKIASSAQAKWQAIFTPPIQARLNANLPGANLSTTEVIYMMDLCPFNTVASPDGTISPFCSLFNETEWHQYNYYNSLNKFYGYSFGNPLGPTQGVGFANELIARLTHEKVEDETSTNHTLDDNPATFPLGRRLYADFSHDSDMVAALSALGIFNGTTLPTNAVVEAPQGNGYSAAWSVPFAARIYIEKMECGDEDDELVRIIVNDRVVPLPQCDSDEFGRCTVDDFIDSLQFARSGGHWDQCFV
ncbi:hypothetical protein AMS68_003341 [Peltaster fructicola]|uniref:Phytase A n=1 Tax=Peltaster fructicola TaxID=286661 RepID=A0A6H0XSW0_9PEZI|nr:hypothetical protein AMS68_003341 [Peltaster fructicola]